MAKRKKAAKAVTTALARRTKRNSVPAPVAPMNVAGVPVEMPASAYQLSDDVNLDVLGLVEIKLTDREEKILSRPVRVEDLRVLPSGQAYLSHPTYTHWFNEAFGRLGWSLRPAAKPRVADSIIIVPYVLYIHGQPAAFAWGEQEYHEGNRNQTYGDATEATVASGLRRCAKRLGVGLELWDKPFLDAYLSEHCVQVLCRDAKHNKTVYQWRRRVDRPFFNEISGRQEQTALARIYQGQDSYEAAREAPRAAAPESRPEAPARPVQSPGAGAAPISEKQLRRLFAILHNSGRNEDVVKRWLADKYGYEHANLIQRHHYEAICEAIQSEEKLP